VIQPEEPSFKLLDAAGRPLPSAASYKAANAASQELSCWSPRLTSADRAMIPEKAIAEGRAWDMVRNNGYARGALQSQKDRVVGASYRLQLQPAYKLLGIDSKTAAKWASEVETEFHAYADDPDCWIDAERRRTFTQLLREGAGSDFVQGEAFYFRQWRPSPSGYATCFTTAEPERISTPNDYGLLTSRFDVQLPNGNRIRVGVELDSWNSAVAYHLRTQHPYDFGRLTIGTWDRIPVFNEFGWRQVIHVYEPERAGQTRGFSGMASTLQKLKMMDMQEDLELQLTQITTALGLYIKTDNGRQHAMSLIGGGGMGGKTPEQALQDFSTLCMDAQSAFYGSSGVNMNGVKLPVLFPGDEIGVVNPHNQPANHEQFKDGLRNQIGRGWGMSTAETTGDFSKTNYSSGRMAVQIAYQAVLAKRASTVNRSATQMMRLWFDEAIVRGRVKPPAGIDYFPDNSVKMSRLFALLTKANWIGAGKTVIDEYKQAKANETILATYQGDLQEILAEGGTDIEIMLDNNVRAREMFIERGLPVPEHLGGPPVTARAQPYDLSVDQTANQQ
jgi:lambda family phage portal protein